MEVTLYDRSNMIAITMTLAEYDILCVALTLMTWSGMGVENDEQKIRRLEAMREATQRINPKF